MFLRCLIWVLAIQDLVNLKGNICFIITETKECEVVSAKITEYDLFSSILVCIEWHDGSAFKIVFFFIRDTFNCLNAAKWMCKYRFIYFTVSWDVLDKNWRWINTCNTKMVTKICVMKYKYKRYIFGCEYQLLLPQHYTWVKGSAFDVI